MANYSLDRMNYKVDFSKSKVSELLVKCGALIIILAAVLFVFILNSAFEPAFLFIIGLVMFFYGLLIKLENKGLFALIIKAVKKVCIVLFLVFSISFIIIEGIIFWPLEAAPQKSADYAVILGTGLRGEIPSKNLTERLNTAVIYLRNNPSLKIVVSGGQGRGESITEAEAMKRYLINSGIDKNRIIKEDKSTSTYENVLYTRNLLDKKEGFKTHKVVIITSDFHLYRAKMLAERVGMAAYGVQSRTAFYLLVDFTTREYFALIKSFVFDR